eukprot:6459698-Amphidinium_carterae.1
MAEAVHFIVKDIDKPPPRLASIAKFVGGVLCEGVYLETRGISGMCLAFKPQVTTRRAIFVTAKFMDANMQFVEDLVDIIASRADA